MNGGTTCSKLKRIKRKQLRCEPAANDVQPHLAEVIDMAQWEMDAMEQQLAELRAEISETSKLMKLAVQVLGVSFGQPKRPRLTLVK